MSLTPERENQIIELAIKGDEKSYNELFVHYRSHLYQYAMQALGEHHLAEDVVQNTLVFCWNEMRSGRYNPKPGKFKHWLLATCKNIHVQVRHGRAANDAEWWHQRAIQRGYERVVWTTLKHNASLLDVEEDVIARESANELKKRVRIHAKRLPKMQRRVLSLTRSGHTDKEISRMLGISRAAVRKNRQRARARLKAA